MHFSIQSFLEKYKNIKDPKEERVLIAKIISDAAGFNITESQISVKKSTILIKANNYLKTEIFLVKEKILKTLNENKIHYNEIR